MKIFYRRSIMKEDFLHFIWKHKLFKQDKLYSTTKETVEVISVGTHNSDAGADFLNAKIKIDGILWAGDVEIHLRASDWARHIHHEDKAYDTVILHVVLIDDVPVRRSNKQQIPTLILDFDKALEKGYNDLMISSDWVPCCRHIHLIDDFHIQHLLGRLAIERLEGKTEHIRSILTYSRGDWYEAFYQLLFRAFGFKINSLPFELLAKSIPFQVIEKHKNSLPQLEALLFGQSGLIISSTDDEYINTLRREYVFLKTKFSLQPIETHLWKFLRLRPSNFPTIRIAQLAQLLHSSVHLTEEILKEEDIQTIIKKFEVQASGYWGCKRLGIESIQTLLINMAVPFVFSYGKSHNNWHICEKALRWLEELSAEDNHIIRGWSSLGLKPKNAFYSQALLQLKTMYCDKKRCLNCAIGKNLLHNGHLIN